MGEIHVREKDEEEMEYEEGDGGVWAGNGVNGKIEVGQERGDEEDLVEDEEGHKKEELIWRWMIRKMNRMEIKGEGRGDGRRGIGRRGASWGVRNEKWGGGEREKDESEGIKEAMELRRNRRNGRNRKMKEKEVEKAVESGIGGRKGGGTRRRG